MTVPLLYFLFSFYVFLLSHLLKKYEIFLKKCGIFLRLTCPKLYFEDQIFAISGQNHKNKFRNNLWPQKFLHFR